jgi:outer membrane receptor protein involved in Fe transport
MRWCRVGFRRGRIRRNFRYELLLAMLVIGVAPAHAQTDALIRGSLVAKDDGSPLGGTVTLEGAGGQTVARVQVDVSGQFSLTRLRPGEYILHASSQGFGARDLRLMLEPHEVRTLRIALAVAGVAVKVEVPGELPHLPSTHSPSSTVLLSSRIDSLPVFARSTLPDAIVSVAPGMIRGHDDFVHVRGEEVALNPLINGVSFWENAHSLFSSGLSPDIIETANVMTGAFPAEYGNRFGGVVDIVTKSGMRMDHRGSVVVSGGEEGRRSVSGELGGHVAQLGYYGFGSILDTDRFLSPPDPEAIHDAAQAAHGLFQLDGALDPRDGFRVVLMGDGVNLEIPRTPEDVELRPGAMPVQHTRQQTAMASWMRSSEHLTIDATMYQRWSRSLLFPVADPLAAFAASTRELLTIGGKIDVTRSTGRHAFKGGIDAVSLQPREHLAYDDTGYLEFAHLLDQPHTHFTQAVAFDQSDNGGQVSGYLQDDVRLGDRVTLDAGVRIDHYALVLSTTHVSPRLNLAVSAGSGTVFHASYNHYFVPPPVEGVLSSAAGLTKYVGEIEVALPPVQPTTEDQLELGAASAAGPMRVGLTGYYRTSDNPVHTTIWPDSRIYSYASFEHGRAFGLEVKGELQGLARRGLTGFLNYALGRVDFRNPVTGGFVTEPEHVESTERFLAPMDQTHTLTGALTYRHQKSGVWLGTMVEFGSGTPIDHDHGGDEHGASEAEVVDGSEPDRVPSHFIWNLSGGVDLLRRSGRPRLTLQVDVENIGDHVYLVAQESEFSARQYSIPRLVSVTAKVRF